MNGGFSSSEQLKRFVSVSVKGSAYTLDELQGKTGIHRSKLGRIRLARCELSIDEAMIILDALDRPARADILFISLGIHHSISRESAVFFDKFLSELPILVERLTAIGPLLNPRWARGSILLLADAIERHSERLREADRFELHAGSTSS